MKNQINCTPHECIKFRKVHTHDELAWAFEVMLYYRCRPISKESRINTAQFVADVFEAGRISGVREERKRKRANSPLLAK